MKTCTKCKGSGQIGKSVKTIIRGPRNTMVGAVKSTKWVERDCPKCDGTGKVKS